MKSIYTNNKINNASVILDFNENLNTEKIENYKNLLKESFPIVKNFGFITFKLGSPKSNNAQKGKGYKLSSEDEKHNILIGGRNITFSQVGKYKSYNDFLDSFAMAENFAVDLFGNDLLGSLSIKKSNLFNFPTNKEFANNLKYVSRLKKKDFFYSEDTNAVVNLRREIGDVIYSLSISQQQVSNRVVSMLISAQIKLNSSMKVNSPFKIKLEKVNDTINVIFKDSTTDYLQKQLL